MPEIIKTKSGGVTTAYMIFAALATVTFGLALGDLSFLYFAVLILLAFVLSAMSDKGSAQKNLSSIGWSDHNISLAIPLGIAGGIITIFIGAFIFRLTPQTSSMIAPDFSATASILTGAVIPAAYALSFNVIGQWLITAPAEEAGYRIVAPFAAMSAFGNEILAFAIASLLWIFTHVPAYVSQNAPNSMYLVLAVFSIVAIALIKITGTVMSAIVAHGTYNTLVLIMSSPLDSTIFIVILSILFILLFIWVRGKK